MATLKDRLSSGLIGMGKRISPGSVEPLFFSPMTGTADTGRRAGVPEWCYQAPYGQPRNIDVMEIRDQAKSPWIHLCKKTIIDDFSTTPWEIVAKDPKSFDESHKKEEEDFCKKPNLNKETLPDIMRQWANDTLDADAGVMVKVFDDSSYETGKSVGMTLRNEYFSKGSKEGEIKKSEQVSVLEVQKDFRPLKPIGKRTLKEIYCRDGATFLADGDYTGFVHRYFQYSFKIPRRTPAVFDRDEIVYSMMSPRSYSFYGWSPVQSLDDVIRTLKEAVLYSLTGLIERGVPDGVLSLYGITKLEGDRLRDYWQKEIYGKNHKLAVVGCESKYTPLSVTAKDMEYLATQEWFVRIVMAIFGIEIPVLSLKGEAPKAGSFAILKRERTKAIMPLIQLFEHEMNAEVLSEFGYDDVEFRFQTYDMEEDKAKRDMDIADASAGIRTINEIRADRGMDPVEWGDEPMRPASPFGIPTDQGNKPNPNESRNEPGANSEEDESEEDADKKKDSDVIKYTSTSTGGPGTPGHALIPVRPGAGRIRRCESCNNMLLSDETKCPFCGSEKISDAEMSISKYVGWDFFGTVKYILLFLEGYSFSQITDISDAQRKDIKSFMISSIKEGWSLNALEDKINSVVKDEEKSRMIARTEVIRAANEGAILNYKEEDVEKVKWIAVPGSPGGRTCKDCLALNGKEFLLKDAQGKIPRHTFCRCCWSPIVSA